MSQKVSHPYKCKKYIFNPSNKILKSRSQWIYHILGMDDRCISKKILTYNPIRQNMGCPQLR
jgi:hypothetical protein